jgi:hypothetical protein
MSMMVIGLSLPILRQRWRCLLYDVYWLYGYCIWSRDRNTWNTIPVSEQKNTLNNLTLNRTKHWIKQSTESNKRKQKPTNITGNKQTGTELLSVLTKRLNRDRSILAWVKYLCDYGTDNCNPVCLNVNYEKSNILTRVPFCLPSGLTSSLLKNP